MESFKQAFKDAVDDYLELCRSKVMKPDHSFSGSFNVRTGSVLHRQAVLYAKEKGLNLNTVVKEAITEYLAHTDDPSPT